MRRLYFAFSAFALALAACQLFVDDLYVDVPGVDRPPTLEDPTPLPASPDLCQHARVPPPPEAGGGSNVGALFFAAKTYQFAPANAPAPGFDLDDLCTGYDASRTSTSACIPPTSDTDDDGGVDNAFSRVAVFKTFGDPEQALNDNAAEGSAPRAASRATPSRWASSSTRSAPISGPTRPPIRPPRATGASSCRPATITAAEDVARHVC